MFREIRLSLLLRVVALLLGIIGSILIARLGGPEIKGVSSAFAAAANIGFTIINLDSAQAALRLARETSDRRNSWKYLSKVWSLYGILIIIGLILLVAVQAPLGWYLLGAVLFGIGQQAAVLSVGFRGAYIGSIGAALQQLTLICCVIAFDVFAELDAINIKLTILISYVVPLVLYLPTFVMGTSQPPDFKTKYVVKLMISNVPWQLGRLFQTLLVKMDVFAVFLLLGAAQSGIYSVGVSTAMLVTLIPAQFAAQALHDISSNKKRDSRQHSRAALISGIVSTLPLAVFGYWIIEIAYGSEFLSAYSVLLACLPGAIAYGIVHVQSNYIRLLGAWRTFLIVNMTGAVIMIFGIYVALVLADGILMGVGLAFSSGTIASAVVGRVLMKRNNIGGA